MNEPAEFGIEPVRFETGRPLLLAGVRGRHEFASADRSLRLQWQQLTSMPAIPGRIGSYLYGVICGADSRGMEFMSAVEVESFERLPEGMGRMRVPRQLCAVFVHDPRAGGLGSTWLAVFEWLARSGYRSAEKPDFELYHPGAHPLSPDEGIEIWLGIVDRGLPSGSIEVRSASPADSDAWLQMRVALWPDEDGRLTDSDGRLTDSDGRLTDDGGLANSGDDPDGALVPAEWHAQEIEQFFAGRLSMPLEVLIAFGPDGAALGFAELSIRPYAEGCTTDKVAYLEGWYVLPQARRRGVGRALIDAAERWAVARGCTEFASDALLENHVSAAAHEALGFEEVDQIRCFRKDLRGR